MLLLLTSDTAAASQLRAAVTVTAALNCGHYRLR
jgi:hypothetical protein